MKGTNEIAICRD